MSSLQCLSDVDANKLDLRDAYLVSIKSPHRNIVANIFYDLFYKGKLLKDVRFNKEQLVAFIDNYNEIMAARECNTVSYFARASLGINARYSLADSQPENEKIINKLIRASAGPKDANEYFFLNIDHHPKNMENDKPESSLTIAFQKGKIGSVNLKFPNAEHNNIYKNRDRLNILRNIHNTDGLEVLVSSPQPNR